MQETTPAGDLPRHVQNVARELLEELRHLRRERHLGHAHGITIEMRHACQAVEQLEHALESGQVTRALVAQVRDCLEKLPLSRPRTAADLLNKLQAQLAG